MKKLILKKQSIKKQQMTKKAYKITQHADLYMSDECNCMMGNFVMLLLSSADF